MLLRNLFALSAKPSPNPGSRPSQRPNPSPDPNPTKRPASPSPLASPSWGLVNPSRHPASTAMPPAAMPTTTAPLSVAEIWRGGKNR